MEPEKRTRLLVWGLGLAGAGMLGLAVFGGIKAYGMYRERQDEIAQYRTYVKESFAAIRQQERELTDRRDMLDVQKKQLAERKTAVRQEIVKMTSLLDFLAKEEHYEKP